MTCPQCRSDRYVIIGSLLYLCRECGARWEMKDSGLVRETTQDSAIEEIRAALAAAIKADRSVVWIRNCEVALTRLDELEAEHEKLLAHAREVAGRRDVHSVYEVLDGLKEMLRALTEERKNG